MLLRRLIWLALVLALVVGSVQTLLQHPLALPLILTAETYEDHAPAPPALSLAHTHGTEAAPAHEHAHDASAWTPQDGAERTFWTWVANVLENLALALMVLVAFSGRVLWRGLPASAPRLAAGVALAGFVGLHLWPSLGLPAELPGAQAADLLHRQMAWGLASVCALLACAVLGWARWAPVWRLAVVLALLALLALPFAIGMPHVGDPYAGFGPAAHQTLTHLTERFVWVSHILAAVQWLLLGAGAALLAPRGLLPLLRPATLRPAALATGEAS